MQSGFGHAARLVAEALGTPWAFFIACLFVVLWLISGPFFQFSDAWQLVINTVTSIVAFLMVFLIQTTQNRDTAQPALHRREEHVPAPASCSRCPLRGLPGGWLNPDPA